MQRLATPWQFDTVRRNVEHSSHGNMASNVKSKAMARQLTLLQPLPDNYTRRIRTKAQSNRYGESKHSDGKHYKNVVRDLETLAQAAARGGNIEYAANTYYKIGVVYDNAEQHEEAIKM